MSNRDTSSTLWERAVIHLDAGNQADSPSPSPRKVVVRPEYPSISILDQVKEGSLPSDTTKIDILGSLPNYESYIIDSPATADLRELSKTEWDELSQLERTSIITRPADLAERNRHISRLMSFDEHADCVGQILRQQELAHPCHDVYETDSWSKSEFLDQARKEFSKFGWEQIQKHKKRFKELKKKKADAKRNDRQGEVAEAVKEMHNHESQALYYWCRKMEENLRDNSELRICAEVDDIADSYNLFQALDTEIEDRTSLNLLEGLDETKAALRSNTDDVLAMLDANLCQIQGLFESSHNRARRASTRMSRLCATDVWQGEEVQKKVMWERFTSGKGFSYYEAYRDLSAVKQDLETARLIFENKIELGYEQMENWSGNWLDVCVDADRVWLKSLVQGCC